MSDLQTLAKDLAHQFIAGFAADQGLTPSATYRRMPRNPAQGANRLDFSSDPISTHSVRAIDESPANPFTRGADADARQMEKEYDLVRFMDSEQFTLFGFVAATGDEWDEGGKIYRIDKIQLGDPAGATTQFSMNFTRAS